MNERSGASSALSRSISLLDPVDLRVGDGEPRAARALFRQAEIGLDVEQVVLDARQRRIERGIARGVQPDDADHGVDLVERAVGVDAQVVLLAPVAGAERRRAVVAGARVDAVQDDHGSLDARDSPDFGVGSSLCVSLSGTNEGESPCRLLAAALAAALLLIPAAAAAGLRASLARRGASATPTAMKKKAKKAKKPKAKKEEYMRAVPSR